MLSGVSDGSALIGDQNVQVLTWNLAPNITAATIVNVRSLIITARRICLPSNSTPAARSGPQGAQIASQHCPAAVRLTRACSEWVTAEASPCLAADTDFCGAHQFLLPAFQGAQDGRRVWHGPGARRNHSFVKAQQLTVFPL
jgi:hypothetical protein